MWFRKEQRFNTQKNKCKIQKKKLFKLVWEKWTNEKNDYYEWTCGFKNATAFSSWALSPANYAKDSRYIMVVGCLLT